MAFHPQGNLLAVAGIDCMATGSCDGRIAVWDVVGRQPVRTFDVGATAVAYSPSGKHLAAGLLTRAVCIWDATTGELIAELERHSEPINSVAYSPDGALLAVGCDDRSVRLWDAVTGQPRGAIELDTQVKALAFSSDGRSLFTGNANTSCYQLDVARLLAARG
jgi:WD40 repeat protein